MEFSNQMEILVAIHSSKTKFLWLRPSYLGFPAMKLSKLHMYEIYFDKLQPYFGQEILHLLYIDTDSFILSINTKNFIKDLKKFRRYNSFRSLR